MVSNYRKQINEIRKDKERLMVSLKGMSKTIDGLEKRKGALNQDGTKLLLEFQNAMQLEY